MVTHIFPSMTQDIFLDTYNISKPKISSSAMTSDHFSMYWAQATRAGKVGTQKCEQVK